jgi:predicted ATP-dependent Lon-type protease
MRVDSKVSKQLYCGKFDPMDCCRFLMTAFMMDEEDTFIQQHTQYITAEPTRVAPSRLRSLHRNCHDDQN